MIGTSHLTLTQKRGLMGWFFISPWIIGFLSLMLYPFLQSFIFSLSKIHIVTGGYVREHVGSENYSYIFFAHPDFLRTVAESIGDMIADVPLILIFSVFAASLIQNPFRGRTLTRTIFFLPVIISSGVVLKLQSQDWMKEILQASLESGEGGGTLLHSFMLKEYLLESGLHKTFVEYITGAVDRIHEIISRSGVQILIALAGLQSIPDSFYEAGIIEGASRWEIFWKITFPVISPLLLASAVYTIIDSFTAYDNETMRMVQTAAFGQSQYGQSAAMAWVYFSLVMLILLTIFAFTRTRIFYRD